MLYIVTFDMYVKQLNTYQNIKKVFTSMSDAIEYIARIKKLKEGESITISAE
jgi:hypothetical protein